MCDFRLQPPSWWGLRSSGLLRSEQRSFLTDVSGQPIGLIFKGQEFLTDRLFWNVGKKLTTTIRVITQDIEVLISGPTQCIYVFCVALWTNSGISLCSVNWPAFITDMKSVYGAVRTEYSNITERNFRLQCDRMFTRKSWYLSTKKTRHNTQATIFI